MKAFLFSLLVSFPLLLNPSPGGQKRVALVIGVKDYVSQPLGNTLNDANDMATTLSGLGFEVIKVLNPKDKAAIRNGVNQLYFKTKGQDAVALFYYSGHGIQHKGKNYLVPTHAALAVPSDLEDQCYGLNSLMTNLDDAANELNIIILDACRNSPFRSFTKDGTKGMAKVDIPKGTQIIYATSPNDVASDGTGGRNGTFTGSLLKYIKVPGLTVEEVFKRTGQAVSKSTQDDQRPWISSDYYGSFRFRQQVGGIQPGEEVVQYGQISIETQVSGQLLLNGQSVGSLRANTRNNRLSKLKPGRYKLELGDWEQWITVSPNQTTSVLIEAKDLPRTAYTETAYGLDMDMIWVAGGSYDRGCKSDRDSDCASDESPSKRITLDGFYMGQTEVTQAQWRAVMGTSPSYFKNCDNCPVENVSHHDIQEFLKKLKQRTGKDYRLPTEAEWEYAARGGQQSRGYQYAGSNSIGEVAWYDDNSYDLGSSHPNYGTNPVGQKKPNELGLYDMSGNVWEWCSDWYGSDYYASASSSNPQGPSSGSYRVRRGGSWSSSASDCRSALRSHRYPDIRNYYLGFRLCRTQ